MNSQNDTNNNTMTPTENVGKVMYFEPVIYNTPQIDFLQKNLNNQFRQYFNLYFIGVLFANFSLLFMKSYEADLGYWHNWVGQLSDKGYDNFNGNYPPIYIHWLYIVGKLYGVLQLPLETNQLLKFLTQIPVVLSHCLLLTIVYKLLKQHNNNKTFFHSVMAFTAFNPAILVNGPIWGQVDLIPVTFVLIAILCCFEKKWVILAAPFFMLSLLTKFQMIAFAPIFGFLFWRDIKKHIYGILLALPLIVLAFIPYVLSNHFLSAIEQAYISTLGQYPKTTFNAANLWILLTGNVVPDHVMLFGVTEDSPLAKLFIAKNFGIACFALLCLLVFFSGLRKLYFSGKNDGVTAHKAYSLLAGFICAVGFFALLPAMHERYMFPATILALAYVCVQRGLLIYAVIAAIICSLNMLIIVQINGSDVWRILSSMVVALLGITLLHSLLSQHKLSRLQSLCKYIFERKYVPWLAIALGFTWMFYYFIDTLKVHSYELKPNQLFLTSLPIAHAYQQHGSLRINRSYDNNTLQVNNHRYEQGIGTHTNSNISFQLPSSTKTFSFTYGVDDEVGMADVQFSVWGDNQLLWQSPVVYGFERLPAMVKLDVADVKLLSLRADKVTDDKWDHANWIFPVITLDAHKADNPAH